MLVKLKNLLFSENFISFIFGLSFSACFNTGIILILVYAGVINGSRTFDPTLIWLASFPLTCYLVFFKWLNFQGLRIPKAWFVFATMIELPAMFTVTSLIITYFRYWDYPFGSFMVLNSMLLSIIPQILIYIGAYKNRILFYTTLLLLTPPTAYISYDLIKFMLR